jgi:hypothetical protein
MAGEPIIYNGPTDKVRGLRHGAIYSGATPKHLQAEIAKNSALANFFVPLKRHAKTRRNKAGKPAAVTAPLTRGPVTARTFGPPIKKR